MRLVADSPIRGYARYIANIWTELVNGKMVTVYIYDAPDSIAEELRARGARETDRY